MNNCVGGKNHILTGNYNESTKQLLNKATNLLQQLGVFEPDRNSKVVDFEHPKELEARLNITIGQCGIPTSDALIALCEEIIAASVKTNHFHFHNQLYSGSDPYGLLGAFITEALNTNQHTYEIAPAFTVTDNAVQDRVLHVFGFPVGECMFSPGGSISNMYGIILARHRLNPKFKQTGFFESKPLVAFTSEDAHYSISKGVNWLGIGLNNLIKVPCDSLGKMIPEQLEIAIMDAKQNGKIPFFVNATAGTTVFGAFDPLNEISLICEKYGLWMHVDACWGGSIIFSKQCSSTLLSGINKADSISWNPHKMLGAPLQCSLFITKHKGILHEANCASATYLFQQDKFYDVSYDTGDKSVQCGRKVDGFKLWLMWKARGEQGFQQLVDNALDCVRYFFNQISNKPGFRLVNIDNNPINVCFWYIPKRLRNCVETDEWWKEIALIAPKIKERLTKQGTLLIGYQPIKTRGLVNFFRLVNTCHPVRKYQDMDHVIQEIDDAGYLM